MKRSAGWLAGIVVIAAMATTVRADDADERLCGGTDNYGRIKGCTALIDRGGHPTVKLAELYERRALGYSMLGQYGKAIADYDVAIKLIPDFAVALNNRAWAYFRSGKAAIGLPDVERSLQLNPVAGHSLDTRAHIRQTMGDPKGALSDYTKAMFYGGMEMIKLYQCGLTEARLYDGRIDGVWRPELQSALEKCVPDLKCDPLPADEHCRPAIS
jgi:tetratricopeptide (TPR) repeat protein